MAVAFDTKFQDGSASETATFSFTSNAPGSGVSGSVGVNTNRGLIGFAALTGAITTPAMTWNTVAMTAIGTGIATVLGLIVYVFGLKGDANVATGAKTLAFTWDAGAFGISLGAVSLYNVDGTTGWQNFTTNTGLLSPTTINVPLTAGNMVVAHSCDDNSSSATIATGTEDYQERDLNGNYLAGHNAASGTVAWTLGTGVSWSMAGIEVIAAAVAAGDETLQSRRMLSVP